MKIVVNGIEFYECGFCGGLHSEIICPCFNERMDNGLKEIFDIFRKRNKMVMINCNGKEREGMSALAFNMANKFHIINKKLK